MKVNKWIIKVGLLLVTLGLVVSSFLEIEIEKLWEGLKKSHIQWVFAALFAHIVNHMLRAYRWKKLVEAQGVSLSFKNAFLGEMSGFFFNTVGGGRIGEVFRCTSVQRLEKVPVNKALAGVVIERVVDLILFFLIILVITAYHFELCSSLLKGLFQQKESQWKTLLTWGLGVLALMALIYYIRKNAPYFRQEWQHFKQALKASRHGVGPLFWGITLLLWVFFFLVEYILLFSTEATSVVTLGQASVVFMIVNIGGALPLPGNGAGTCHTFVPMALEAFGVAADPHGMIYALFTHGVQFFNAVVLGGACAAFAFYQKKKKKLKNDVLTT